MDLEAEHGTDYIISLSEGCGNVLDAASEHDLLTNGVEVLLLISFLETASREELEDLRRVNSGFPIFTVMFYFCFLCQLYFESLGKKIR